MSLQSSQQPVGELEEGKQPATSAGVDASRHMRNIDSNCHYLSRFTSREELLGKTVVGVLGAKKSSKF